MYDYQNLFSDRQSIAAAAGTVRSEEAIDLWRKSGRDRMYNNALPDYDPGKGEPVPITIQVVEDVVGAGATVRAQIVTADDKALTTNATVLSESAAIGVAQLKAGYQFRLAHLPRGVYQRYLGVQYVIAGAATTAGAVTAGIQMNTTTAIGTSS